MPASLCNNVCTNANTHPAQVNLGTRQANTFLSTGSTNKLLAPDLVLRPPGSHSDGADEGSRHGAGG